MKLARGIVPVVMSLVLVGCATAPRSAMDFAPEAEARAETPPAAARPVGAHAGEATPAAAAVPANRQVIYTATLRLVVPDTVIALQSIQSEVQALGGYLQRMNSTSITVRVPATKLNEAMSAVSRLGAVTERTLEGQDITEEMHDLQIRLETALEMRKQLLAILEKADKTADAIKVEQELERVVLTIEQLKGKIRFYEAQVAFSTLTVNLNAPLAQTTVEQRVPFAWVRALAGELVGRGMALAPDKDASGGIKFSLPRSYIRYYGRDCLVAAMSGDDVYIKAQRQDNYRGGDLGFWTTLARRVLVESRCIAIDSESDVTLLTGARAHVYQGTRQVSGKPFGYLAAIVARKHEVYVLEAWGPEKPFKADLAELLKTVQSLDVDP